MFENKVKVKFIHEAHFQHPEWCCTIKTNNKKEEREAGEKREKQNNKNKIKFTLLKIKTLQIWGGGDSAEFCAKCMNC